MSKPSGGAAFPSHAQANCSDGETIRYDLHAEGLTLRDFFAAQALAGLLAAEAHPDSAGIPDAPESNAVFAAHAYALSDAMLAEREK